MIAYDGAVIEKFAQKLYSRANSIMVSYTLFGALIGFGLGTLAARPSRLSESFASSPSVDSQTIAIIGAALFGLFGFILGSEKAFFLKLQAQLALCQARIEENTRARAGVSGGPLPSAPIAASASRPAV